MKNMYLLVILILSGFSPGILSAQEKASSVEMKTYYIALLKAGDKRDQPEELAAEIQAAHMAYINALAKEGKLVLAGPILDDSELKGIFIFEVESMEEAIALTEQDPAVKAGRLIMALHPWYGPVGLRYDGKP